MYQPLTQRARDIIYHINVLFEPDVRIVCKHHTESLTLTNAMTEALVINSVVILGGE